MAIWRKTLLFISFALISAPGIAQQSAHEIERAAELEERQRTIEVQMREAEERLAAAARQIAELSSSQLPPIRNFERRIYMDGRAVLGITIGSSDGDGPVEGVTVRGVSPGGAAEDAGLRSGDIITAINDEPLTAASDEEANTKLIGFMSGVEEDDVVEVEYLRDGKQASVEVRPHEMSPPAYAYRSGRGNYTLPRVANVPQFDVRKFAWFSDGSGWGHMEMVALTERLGTYFGTDKGLLVVRAPDDENLKLQDGDVIQSIDGREPKSVSHAMRILGSYQSGEQLEMKIMRDKRKQTLKIEMPDNQSSSWVLPRVAPRIESDLMIVPKARVHRADRT